VLFDAIRVKVRDEGFVRNKATGLAPQASCGPITVSQAHTVFFAPVMIVALPSGPTCKISEC
jgi:hypothetical protein